MGLGQPHNVLLDMLGKTHINGRPPWGWGRVRQSSKPITLAR
jgi:hypothetical protein